jgi:hypothetical protein
MINDVMYSALYPSSKQAKVLDASDLTMLCALIPLRFDFNVVDGNVLAFLDQFRNNVEAAFVGYDDKNSIQKSFFYQYDCLLYRAEISVVPTMYKGYLNHSYNMRFSNDGFLYLPDSVHGVDRTGIERHHGSNWSRLQHAQIRKLPVVTDFAEQLLGSGYGTMFFYSFELQRMDVKFVSKRRNRCLTFSFEPGYPAEDSFEDYWFEPVTPDSVAVEGILTERDDGDYT